MVGLGPALGPLTPKEAELLDRAVTFLRRFIPEAYAFFVECQTNPKPGSQMARLKRRDLILALDASLLLDSAQDHLTTVINQCERGLLSRYSLYTVIRGALEADAWACWMLEPGIGDDERLARALTLRSSSLFEMKRLGLAPPRVKPERHYAKRMKRVLSAGKRWKLAAKTDKWGRVSFVPQPRVTPLLRTLLPDASPKNKALTVGEQTYGELSARAHGTTWSLLQSLVAVQRLNRYQNLGMAALDVVEFVRLLGVVVGLHDEVIKRTARLANVATSDWEARRGPMPW